MSKHIYKDRETYLRITGFKDLTGKVFGSWTVIKRVPKPEHLSDKAKHSPAFWLCRCVCGKEMVKRGHCLTHGRTLSCGCKKERPWERLEFGGAMVNSLYYRYQYSAKKRNKVFELTKDQFYDLTQQNCFYCGNPPSSEKKTNVNYGSYVYNGIDRVDNLLGYTPDNCVPCCSTCNKMKLQMNIPDFLSHIQQILDYTKIMFVKKVAI